MLTAGTPKFLLLSFLLLAGFAGLSQPCTQMYRNEYGGPGIDEALAVAFTPDRGAIIGGRTTTRSAGNFDGFLMKLTESGTLAWSRNYGNAEYNEIYRVRPTPDGGYLAMGLNRTSGTPAITTFLLKTDGMGNTQWSRTCQWPGVGPMRGKDIIVLRDGGYALLLNVNDSSANSDGIVARLDPAGAPIWSFRFDQGRADGFNALVEEADSLVVGGYATLGTRDIRNGLVMKMNTRDGTLFHQYSFERTAGYEVSNWFNTEVTMVDTTSGGLYFAAQSVPNRFTNFTSLPTDLQLFKRSNNGLVYFQRKSTVGTPNGLTLETVRTIRDHDSGFAFLSNDTSEYGGAEFKILGPSGLLNYSSSLLENYERCHMPDMDRTGNYGFIAAGWVKTGYGQEPADVRIIKMDRIGRFGSCSFPMQSGEFQDTVIHHFGSFTWATREVANGLIFPEVTLATATNAFTQTITCTDNYCPPVSTIPDACNATFLVHIKGESGRFLISNLAATSDGGFLATGQFARAFNREMAIVKLRPSGDIDWAKTYEQFPSESNGTRVYPSSDGNYFVVGSSSAVINHLGYNSVILMKIDPAGNVLWERTIDEEYSAAPDEVLALPDGGLIMTLSAYAHTRSVLRRIDASGSTVWSRRQHLSSGSGMRFQRMFLDGDDLYLAGVYGSTNGRFAVQRWDIRTGSITWHRRLLAEITSGLISSITKSGDSLYLAIGGPSITGGKMIFQHNIVQLHVDGTPGGVYRLLSPDQGSGIFTPAHYQIDPVFMVGTGDGHFVIAQLSSTNTGNNLVITKFNPASQGQAVWVRRYPALTSHTVNTLREHSTGYVLGGRFPSSQRFYENLRLESSFVMAIDVDGQLNPNATGLCADSTGTFLTEPGNLLRVEANDLDSIVNDNNEERKLRFSIVRTIALSAVQPCSLPATCTSANIAGPDTICSTTAIYRYAMRTNTGCTARAIWMLDSARIQIVSRTDSTIDLRFPRTGAYRIQVQLSTGCRTLGATKDVLLPRLGNTLSLGADTSLCPGNQLRLRAGSGFRQYQWHDGSTDSSFTVTAPGTYHVRITDACGSVFRDTLVVHLRTAEPIDAGPDLRVCIGDTVQLRAPAGYSEYQWSNNQGMPTFSGDILTERPIRNTTYFLQATGSPGCMAYDTLTVTVNQPSGINLGRDTAFCAGQSFNLDAGPGFLRYRWNTGDTTREISINTAGFFGLQAIDINGCTSTDSMQVTQIYTLPRPDLQDQPVLCENSNVTLSPSSSYTSYSWNTGEQTPSLIVTQPGRYRLEVTDGNGCVGSDSVQISDFTPAPRNFLPADQVICSYSTLTLQPNGNFAAYRWQDNSTARGFTVNREGTYWLEVTTAAGCRGRDSIVIQLEECRTGFFMPNAFTPNNDGLNDRAIPLIFGNLQSYEFVIFNRFGEKVFSSRDPQIGWDGTFKGKTAPTGTFTWYCIYQLQGQQPQKAMGTITLIR
jgi:gliding motility-associated-like protein